MPPGSDQRGHDGVAPASRDHEVSAGGQDIQQTCNGLRKGIFSSSWASLRNSGTGSASKEKEKYTPAGGQKEGGRD